MIGVTTVAIDPGTKSTGFAFFHGDTLSHVARAKGLRCNNLDTLDFEKVRKWRGCCTHFVCEVPQVYPQSKADPNDMIPLALLAGSLVGFFGSPFVKLPKPREWKGQVPKKIHNARTLAALTPAELQLCGGLSHDEIDAVGLGLWYLGRTGK